MFEPGEIPLNDDDLYGHEKAIEEVTEEFVSFRLADEWYALPIQKIQEIIPIMPITFLPSLSAFVLGIASLRGNIISVIDPKQLLGLPSTLMSKKTRLIIIHTLENTGALLVDEVSNVLTIPVQRLEAPLETLDPQQGDYVQHTCRWKGQLMAILRPEKLLIPIS